MLTTPHTYAQWFDVLQFIAQGDSDDEVLKAIQEGTLEQTRYVSEQFGKDLANVIREREKLAETEFYEKQKQGVSENALADVLRQLKQVFCSLERILKGIPLYKEDEKKELITNLLDDPWHEIIKQLEQEASKEKTGFLNSYLYNVGMNTFREGELEHE